MKIKNSVQPPLHPTRQVEEPTEIRTHFSSILRKMLPLRRTYYSAVNFN